MKHFTFIPSLSTAVIFKSFQEDFKIGGKTIKFWDKNIGKDLYHPAFLITAGNHYKNINAAEDVGLDVSNKELMIMADSGGHQIATGAMKYNKENVHKIFNWLEHNSNVAINLDIPPRSKIYSYEESKRYSNDNFKYFYEHQTGKTDFLSVFQGRNKEEMLDWYKMSSQYDFSGWAAAIGGNINQTILGIAVLLDKKEHLKKHNKYIHILGVSRIDSMLVLEYIQKLMHEINPNIKIMTDSSSPSRASMFGNIFTGINWDKMSYQSVNISNRNKYNLDTSIIRASAYDDFLFKHMKSEEIYNWTAYGYTGATLHNLYLMLDGIKKIQSIVYTDAPILKQVLPKNMYLVFKSLDEMFASDTPLKVYDKYVNLYNKFKKIDNAPQSNTAITDLFEF